MVADVYYHNCRMAIVTQEEGINNMVIQIFSPNYDDDSTLWTFKLDDFIGILNQAKKTLITMQKLPDEEADV